MQYWRGVIASAAAPLADSCRHPTGAIGRMFDLLLARRAETLKVGPTSWEGGVRWVMSFMNVGGESGEMTAAGRAGNNSAIRTWSRSHALVSFVTIIGSGA